MLDARRRSASFDAFAEMTAHIASMLAEIDATETGEPSVRWVIRDLRSGSAEVAIEVVPLNPLFDMSERVARQMTRGLDYVAHNGARPEWFSDAAWDDARAVVRVLHDGVARLSIEQDDERVVLTNAVQLPEAEGDGGAGDRGTERPTSIQGSLDQIFGHYREVGGPPCGPPSTGSRPT